MYGEDGAGRAKTSSCRHAFYKGRLYYPVPHVDSHPPERRGGGQRSFRSRRQPPTPAGPISSSIPWCGGAAGDIAIYLIRHATEISLVAYCVRFTHIFSNQGAPPGFPPLRTAANTPFVLRTPPAHPRFIFSSAVRFATAPARAAAPSSPMVFSLGRRRRRYGGRVGAGGRSDS